MAYCCVNMLQNTMNVSGSGYLSGYSSRSKRWEFPKSPVEGFKLGQFLDRHQGFEKVNTEESDDDGSNSSSEIIAQNPQFA